MGKSKKAPSYATATYDTGDLFGSATASKKGVTFNPASWMSGTMGTVGNNVNSTLQSMISGDYANDPNFRAYQNNLNKQMTQAYDTDVLSQLANRGLMRSSGLQSATNAFANTLADNQTKLYDTYYQRQASNLANLLNTSNTIYNYLTGVGTGAQNQANNVSNYNLAQAQANDNSGLYASLANSAANIGGSAAGLAALGML
jgi:hypothetical protein